MKTMCQEDLFCLMDQGFADAFLWGINTPVDWRFNSFL